MTETFEGNLINAFFFFFKLRDKDLNRKAAQCFGWQWSPDFGEKKLWHHVGGVSYVVPPLVILPFYQF